jgi:hypothetical protein
MDLEAAKWVRGLHSSGSGLKKVAGSCERGNELLHPHKMRKIYRLAEKLLDSRE